MKPEYDNGKILFQDGEKYVCRKDSGGLTKIPVNKFSDGEIVRTVDDYFSPKEFTMLIMPSYSSTHETWFYGEQYIGLQGGCGGSGHSFREENFKKLTNPILKLYAKRYKNKERIESLKSELTKLKNSQDKIEFALKESVPNWDSIKNARNLVNND